MIENEVENMDELVIGFMSGCMGIEVQGVFNYQCRLEVYLRYPRRCYTAISNHDIGDRVNPTEPQRPLNIPFLSHMILHWFSNSTKP